MKSIYLTELLRLEAWAIVRNGVVVVADNVAGLKHLESRARSIQSGKRSRVCTCVNKACNYVNYVRNSGQYTSQVFWGPSDGLEVSVAVRTKEEYAAGGSADCREMLSRQQSLR